MSESFDDSRRQARTDPALAGSDPVLGCGPSVPSGTGRAELEEWDEAVKAVVACEACLGAPCPVHAERLALARKSCSGALGGRASRCRRVFTGTLDQMAEVRRFVQLVADGHEAMRSAELVACELGANAVLHTRSGQPGGWFAVEVRFGPDEVTVAVTDQGSDREPTARPADAEEVSGRGLWMVELLSLRWGCEPAGEGRRIWAVLPASDDHEEPGNA
ncbi:ATP-binding protein [Actinocorallia libanotica]|uniref:Histidine kinase/HSP90-like ATPase domain-containing protein n=1 Tax=Actinocorallia libanotica TaxID=46162 RepID=A0ABP4C927_9ACTN